MDSGTIRIVCAVLAVLLIGVIVMRRRKHAE
jgi:preprotein translocase subunit SecG